MAAQILGMDVEFTIPLLHGVSTPYPRKKQEDNQGRNGTGDDDISEATTEVAGNGHNADKNGGTEEEVEPIEEGRLQRQGW